MLSKLPGFGPQDLPVLNELLRQLDDNQLDYLPLAGGTMTGDIDMDQNEIQNWVVENRTSDPASPVAGQIWFRTDV